MARAIVTGGALIAFELTPLLGLLAPLPGVQADEPEGVAARTELDVALA